jgi:hypothetical protein
MKTCWSGSHIQTRYSNKRTWALIPGIQNILRDHSLLVQLWWEDGFWHWRYPPHALVPATRAP